MIKEIPDFLEDYVPEAARYSHIKTLKTNHRIYYSEKFRGAFTDKKEHFIFEAKKLPWFYALIRHPLAGTHYVSFDNEVNLVVEEYVEVYIYKIKYLEIDSSTVDIIDF